MPENHQHIYGAVEPDGHKKFGEGFISEKHGSTGTYKVTFEHDFAKDTIAGVGCTILGEEALLIHVTELTKSFFTCAISDTAGNKKDSGFTFIAFGDKPPKT